MAAWPGLPQTSTYNSDMRLVALLIMLLSCAVHAQSGPDAFEIAQRFADTSAPQLALARVEQMQPASPTAARWADWEQLRCILLARLARHQELTKRVAALPLQTGLCALASCMARAQHS